MLKVLILCRKLDTVKLLTNKVISKISDLKIIGITNDLSEAEKIIQEIQADIIFSTNEEIISLIKNKFLFYFPEIILFSKKRQLELDITYKNLLVLDLRLKFDEIRKQVSAFIKGKVLPQKEKATKILSNLGFDFKLAGTLYILDSILYVHSYQGASSFEKLKNDVYPYIAEKNNTSIERVKWSVERAINYMYDKHTQKSYKIVEKYFSITFPTKPTPKLVITLIANNLDL